MTAPADRGRVEAVLAEHDRASGVRAAVRARQARAALKSSLTFSGESLADALAAASGSTPEAAALRRMRVRDLLAAMPGVGPVRAQELMDAAAIAPGRRIQGLGVQQRAALVSAVQQRSARRSGHQDHRGGGTDG